MILLVNIMTELLSNNTQWQLVLYITDKIRNELITINTWLFFSMTTQDAKCAIHFFFEIFLDWRKLLQSNLKLYCTISVLEPLVWKWKLVTQNVEKIRKLRSGHNVLKRKKLIKTRAKNFVLAVLRTVWNAFTGVECAMRCSP